MILIKIMDKILIMIVWISMMMNMMMMMTALLMVMIIVMMRKTFKNFMIMKKRLSSKMSLKQKLHKTKQSKSIKLQINIVYLTQNCEIIVINWKKASIR